MAEMEDSIIYANRDKDVLALTGRAFTALARLLVIRPDLKVRPEWTQIIPMLN
jgi:hypothetical protein